MPRQITRNNSSHFTLGQFLIMLINSAGRFFVLCFYYYIIILLSAWVFYIFCMSQAGEKEVQEFQGDGQVVQIREINHAGLAGSIVRVRENIANVFAVIQNYLPFNFKMLTLLIIPLLLFLFISRPEASAQFKKNDQRFVTSNSQFNSRKSPTASSENGNNRQTSSSIKYGSVKIDRKQFIKNIEYSLKTRDNVNTAKYLSSTTINKNYSVEQESNYQINQLANKASSLLINPEYPEYLGQILVHQPYQQLPFCLITKLVSTEPKFQQKEIVRSIFDQKYQNFITIFLADADKGLTDSELNQIQKQSYKESRIPNRMFYRLNYPNPNYYDYRYLMHELCPENAFVMFVSSPLKPNGLNLVYNFHQLFPVYLTYSRTQFYHHVNSFAMRLFDLISINDFNGSNQKYLQESRQEKLISLGLLELCRKYTKKLAISQIYESKPRATSWMTGILDQDTKTYIREPYQQIFDLAQSYQIDLQQKLHISFEAPKQQTQLRPNQRNRAIEYQSLLFLPRQHALNKRQQVEISSTYGPKKRQQTPTPPILPQTPLCTVILGSSTPNPTTSRKQRYINNIESVLRQRYTNYHVVYVDDGVDYGAMELVKQSVRQGQDRGQGGKGVEFVGRQQMGHGHGYDVVRVGFEKCGADQIMVVVHSDFQIIGPQLFSLINYMTHYNPNIWVLNTNFKSTKQSLGFPQRITTDHQFRNFSRRLHNHLLSPLLIAHTKLIRNIPLNYLQKSDGKWIKNHWYEAFARSLMELATFMHIQYVPEIFYQCSQEYYLGLLAEGDQKGQEEGEGELQEIYRLDALPPLGFLNRAIENQQQIKQKLNVVSIKG